MFKKLLRDAGLVTDDAPAAAKLAPLTPTVISTQMTRSGPGPEVTSTTPATVDDRAVKVLMDKVNQSTVPGYPDFVAMNQDLTVDIPDVTVRAQTALKTVVRMKSIAPQTILLSVEDRQARLAKALEHVGASISNLLKDELSARDATLAEIQSEKKRLETELINLQVKEASLQAERKTVESDLLTKQTNLQNAAASIGAQLKQDRDIIFTNLN